MNLQQGLRKLLGPLARPKANSASPIHEGSEVEAPIAAARPGISLPPVVRGLKQEVRDLVAPLSDVADSTADFSVQASGKFWKEVNRLAPELWAVSEYGEPPFQTFADAIAEHPDLELAGEFFRTSDDQWSVAIFRALLPSSSSDATKADVTRALETCGLDVLEYQGITEWNFTGPSTDA